MLRVNYGLTKKTHSSQRFTGQAFSRVPIHNVTKLEPLKCTYKIVNDHKIEITGQTKATVKRNKQSS